MLNWVVKGQASKKSNEKSRRGQKPKWGIRLGEYHNPKIKGVSRSKSGSEHQEGEGWNSEYQSVIKEQGVGIISK